MDRIDTMANTVEDPDPNINRQIAVWLNQRDLKLGGQNLTEAVGAIDLPLLVIAARHDGIVPEKTAYSVMDAWGGDDIESLTVGDAQTPYAHANLFVANDAPRLVFAPLIDWMIRKSAG